jgi:hypothetical protein
MIEATRERTAFQQEIRNVGFLIVGLFFLAVATPARAAEHVVRGCLALEDARFAPPTAPTDRGGNNRLDELEVVILFTDVFGNEHQALPVAGRMGTAASPRCSRWSRK